MTLKDKNRPLLITVVLINVAVYLSVLNSGLHIQNWFDSIVRIQEYAPLLVISILVGILNGLLDHASKARLVFWKWTNPLPGCRAFSEYIHSDPRIDKNALEEAEGPLPTKPDEQNALWFKWYRSIREQPEVKRVHREYLFTRDYCGIAFLFLIGFGMLALWQFDSNQDVWVYTGILLVQYLAVRQVAKNHGTRFVATILAYRTTG